MTRWPEDDWERIAPHITVDPDAMANMLGEAPRSVELLTGGKANTNYKVELEDGFCVLRIYERDGRAARREAKLLPLVADVVPVPAILGGGECTDGRPFALLEFVEGAHPHQFMNAENAGAIGTALGGGLRALERVPMPGGGVLGLFDEELGFKETFDSVAHSFVDLIGWSVKEGRARKRLGDLRAPLRASIDTAARRLEAVDDWRGVTHGDYKFSNILVAQGELAAVLDWEFACVFTPLLDVAIMMRHRDDFPPDFVDGFESGHGGLPDDWRELSRIMDLMNLVGFLNASGDRPALFAHVLERIRGTLPLIS